ncbi:uncharacterized protein LOC121384440 isoform X2 [Gigantopelta aegis]|uniref:uncharacterized protein LOC121384440 isoform X2 n=1 Tax=Gigantopelta aegis TaxID=1735272 RepID=UPI001B88C64E|nr:uncharacterized protein LOC121384440 isoform X2 [Gigantopelta aegis]
MFYKVLMDNPKIEKSQTPDSELISLVVGDGTEADCLRDIITDVVFNHNVQVCCHSETYDICNSKVFQIIWLKMKVPTSQEVLSLTTSIRYASKLNRGTVIIGISESPSDVELRLHGIDQVLVEPVTKAVVRQKYMEQTCVQLRPNISITDDSELLENPSTPATPCTPASICSDSINTSLSSRCSTPSDCKGSSTIQPPVSDTGVLTVPSLRSFDFQSINYQPRPPPQSIAADHTTKEKVRRERIKDSCDQLRVLLPYIRGRKTDMASILEMTVDYLKIVNTALPQDFQNQVINILSNGTRDVASPTRGKGDGNRPAPRRSSRRTTQPPESPSVTRVTSTVEAGSDPCHVSSGYEVFDPGRATCTSTPGPASTTTPVPGAKRDLTDSYDVKPVKRMHLSNELATPKGCQGPMIYISGEIERTEPTVEVSKEDNPSPLHLQPLHLAQSHLYADDNNRLYSGSFLPADAYQVNPHSQLPPTTTSRVSGLDRDSYGLYLDTGFYHYYTGQTGANTSYATNGLSDYVNPNAVLPMAYSARLGTGHKYDDHDRYAGLGATDDLYSFSSKRGTT